MKTLKIVLCLVAVAAVAYAGKGGFTDIGDGTISDLTTGLIWQKSDDSATRTWESALDYCETLSLGGSTNWRLPQVKELQSLVDTDRHHPATDPVFAGTKSAIYWSSSTNKGAVSQAWYVTFDFGYVFYESKTAAHYVRCVR
jgi:hypothetical protein